MASIDGKDRELSQRERRINWQEIRQKWPEVGMLLVAMAATLLFVATAWEAGLDASEGTFDSFVSFLFAGEVGALVGGTIAYLLASELNNRSD